MQNIFLFFLLFSYACNVFADLYISSDMFAYSEPVTVKGAFKGWQGTFRGGDTAVTYNRLETGVIHKRWKLGIFKRYDYEIEFSSDTADFIYRIENKKPLEIGKTYELDLRVRHSYFDGVRLSYDLQPAKHLNLTVGASYLKGQRLTEGSLQGTATALSENDYDFEFYVDYFYSRDSLFGRKVQSPTGNGYSMDIHILWQPTAAFTTSLTIEDLIGRINWNKAPRTKATATSNVKEYDEDGYVIFKPAISGFETNENFTQTLHRKSTLKASYLIIPDIHLLGRVYNTKVITLAQLGAEYFLNEGESLQFLYMFDAEAITVGYRTQNGSFSVISDSIKFSSAHTFGLNFAYIYKF